MLRGTYLELQFSRQSITELVRTSLILRYPPFNPILPPTGYSLPPASDGAEYVVAGTAFLTGPGAMGVRHGATGAWNFAWQDLSDHVEPVPSRRCEVTQRLRLVVARRRLSLVTGEIEDTEVGPVEGTLAVDVGGYVADNLPRVTVSAVQFVVESQGVDPPLAQVLESTVPTWFADVESPLSLRNLLGESEGEGDAQSELSAPHVQNCGVALAADRSVVAMRLQLGGAAAAGLLSEWAAFHAGQFPNRLALPDGTSRQWGVLLSPSEVSALTVRQTERQLARHADEFRLTSGVGAAWSPQGATPHVHGDFHGTVLVPCRPDYHVTFDGRIDLPQPNRLVTVSKVARTGDFWDLLACEGLVALGTGTAGGAVGAGIGGPLGAGLGFGIGFGVGFFGTMLVATVYAPEMGTETCTQDGDVVTCTREMRPAVGFGGARLAIEVVSATATDDGLLLGGAYTLPSIPALRHTILEVEIDPFDYAELPVNCGNVQFGFLVATSEHAADFTYPVATITARAVDDDGTPHPVPGLTVARTSADHLGVFPPTAIQVVPYPDRTLVIVRPNVSETVNAAYWNAPYGVRIALTTIYASRTVSLGAVPRMTPEKLQALRGKALRKLNDCLARQEAVVTGMHKAEWLVDPPYADARAEHLWAFAALGLAPDEQLTLEDERGVRVATTRADGRGTARLTVRTPGGAGHQAMTLRRGGAGFGDGAAQWDIRLKQIELLPQGDLVPGGIVRDVQAREVDGRRLAAVRTSEVVTLYDLTFAETPRALLRAEAASVAGVALLDGGLAAWGRDGLTVWSLDGRPRRLVSAPVSSARIDRGALVVATADGTLRVDRDAARAVPIAAVGCDAPIERLARDAARLVDGAVDALLGACGDASDDTNDGERARGEHYTVGTTLLAPSADRRALHHFVAGRWVDL